MMHYPDEFIPVFEENGCITELDMYMLEEACKKVSCWVKQGYQVRPISVNQSRVFFYDDEYLVEAFENKVLHGPLTEQKRTGIE